MTAERPLQALDRAALLLQLVPYLIGKGEVSVAEAAKEFDVTPGQMRAMVERLTVIGLPGERGYWQLPNELFDIDWDLLERDPCLDHRPGRAAPGRFRRRAAGAGSIAGARCRTPR